MLPLPYRFFGSLGAVLTLIIADVLFRTAPGQSLVCNPGIAFGIGMSRPGLLFLNGLILVLLFGLWCREKEKLMATALLLLVAGGIGNFLDRWRLGCVRDSLTLPFWPGFPTFNLSDIFISLGAGLLGIGLYRTWRRSREHYASQNLFGGDNRP